MKKLIAALSAGLLTVQSIGVIAADAYTAEELELSEIKPTLHLSEIVLTEEDLSNSHDVVVKLELEGAERKYSTMEIWAIFDERLTIDKKINGDPSGSFGSAVTYLNSSLKNATYFDQKTRSLVDLNGIRYIGASFDDLGFDGNIYSVKVTLPDDAKAGDIYPLDLIYIDSTTVNNAFVNSSFLNSAQDETGKLMQAWLFENGLHDGYIKIQGDTEPVYGDANLDGRVSTADVVTVLQYIANQQKYPLSADAIDLADVSNRGDGITAKDAFYIQLFDAGSISSLPESYMTP